MNNRILQWATLLIILGAGAAAVIGVSASPADADTVFTNLYGEQIQLYGNGIYRNDSLSYGAQARGQDIITLLVGIPLLLSGWLLMKRRSLRGQLVHAGSLGYFLYTYSSYSYLSFYNPLFLLYVLLFSLSLFGFITAFNTIDARRIQQALSGTFPRRTIGIYLIFMGAVLTLLWLGKIIPTLDYSIPAAGLDHYTTLVIQANDLAIIVPTAAITGILLLKSAPLGFKLAAILLMKMLTMGMALIAMMIVMTIEGTPPAVGEAVIFSILLLLGLAASALMLLGIRRRSVF